MNSQIKVEEFLIGKGSFIHPSAIIRGLTGPAKRVQIGDNCYIGEQVQIICDDFCLGDYGKIHHHTNIHGYKPCQLGHNVWIGQYSIIDSIGGTTIGNNCGIGAHSQLWSHIKYGDTLEGCQFNSTQPLQVGNDVWFVGHCIVSPITAADKSMALVGSVVTKNMEYNTIYAGVPAVAVSDRIGPQFREVTIAEKIDKLSQYLQDSGCDPDQIKIVETTADFSDDGKSYFAVTTREYQKTGSAEEIKFMEYLLPEKAKFVPFPSN